MYVSFYNLSDRPFQLNPDTRFFFESRQHKRVMAYFAHGFSEGAGFIVLTGEVGAGKTMIVSQLLNQLDGGNYVIARIVTTQVEADDSLRMLASAFRLPFEGSDKATLIRSIEAFLTECHKQRKQPVLVVDEVQNMPASALEELRMLTNYQLDNKPLLQCVLVGQPQFRELLARPDMEQLRQRVVASRHLTPLDAAETRAYVEHRLAMVGWAGDPSLGQGGFEMIHRYSRGIPRRINALCGRLLLFGCLEELHHLDDHEVTEVVRELEDETGEFSAGEPPARAATAAPIVPNPARPPTAVADDRVVTPVRPPDRPVVPRVPDNDRETLEAISRRVTSLKHS